MLVIFVRIANGFFRHLDPHNKFNYNLKFNEFTKKLKLKSNHNSTKNNSTHRITYNNTMDPQLKIHHKFTYKNTTT